jgi:hypothetical protein
MLQLCTATEIKGKMTVNILVMCNISYSLQTQHELRLLQPAPNNKLNKFGGKICSPYQSPSSVIQFIAKQKAELTKQEITRSCSTIET